MITFIRHAETIENANMLLQGANTGDFTEPGKVALDKLYIALLNRNFDMVFSSDLRRCLATTQAIVDSKLDIQYLPLLREKNNGNFVGKPALSIDWDALPGTFESRKLPGGESLNDVKVRAIKFWDILKAIPDKEILVIGHGAFLKILFGVFMSFNLYDSIFSLHIDHCSLTTVDLLGNNKPRFITFNDTSHLA